MELLTHPGLFLGAVGEPTLPLPLQPDTRFDLRGSLPFLMVFGVSVLAVLAWATLIRRPMRRKERGQLLDHSTGRGSGSAPQRSSRRRRRRRHGHRPMAPTLAETGGLPPRGAGESSQPSS